MSAPTEGNSPGKPLVDDAAASAGGAAPALDLGALQKLLDEATPSPWQICAHWTDPDCPCGSHRGYLWAPDGERVILQMGCETDEAGQTYPVPGKQESRTNIHLIAALRNAAPELLRIARLATSANGVASKTLVDELGEALDGLLAVVRGECPSLIDEDSGGTTAAQLRMQIDAALAKWRASRDEGTTPASKGEEEGASASPEHEPHRKCASIILRLSAHLDWLIRNTSLQVDRVQAIELTLQHAKALRAGLASQPPPAPGSPPRTYAEGLEAAARLAETWGNAPPNPDGRRAALARAIRSLTPANDAARAPQED